MPRLPLVPSPSYRLVTSPAVEQLASRAGRSAAGVHYLAPAIGLGGGMAVVWLIDPNSSIEARVLGGLVGCFVLGVGALVVWR